MRLVWLYTVSPAVAFGCSALTSTEKRIRPLPSPYTLATAWRRTLTFCCDEYKDMVLETFKLEEELRAEADGAHFWQDIKPHAPYKPKRKAAHKPLCHLIAEKHHYRGYKTIGNKNLEAKLRELKGTGRMSSVPTKNQNLDTNFVKWDPYEVRYGHPKFFNDEIYDDGSLHTYGHPNIILSVSGIYS